MQQHYDTSSVFVAVIGRPNVGKSSLTNRLVGEKVAIVTSKPQTTRTRITGVVTRGPLQYVLLDTPGVHKAHNKLGKRMDKTASDSIADVDVSMMLFEPYGALNEPEMVLVDALRSSGGPAIAVINKTDLVKEPADLEARKAELKELGVFDAIYTVSVRADDHCEELFDALSHYAVEGPHYFDDDAYTDMPEKELVAEVIREKALLYMRDEIPHGIAVVVERFKERPGTDLVDIDVNIYCERESHKGMVIGKGGAMLKKIASSARADCEEFLGCRVNLQCWVKVKADWRDNEFLLNNFGFKGLQQAPCGVEAVVQQIGLILLDIEVNGVGGAVGQMHIVPRILAARLRLVLLAGHPDRQSVVVQQQPVEGAGQAHLFDLEAQGVEERPEVDGRHAQRHHGQHHREQGCAVFLSHLRQADTGRHQQNGREHQRPVPRLVVA